MSVPTTQGRPWFDTSGTYVKLYVEVGDDLNPGDRVTRISIWGASTTTTKCVDASKTSSPAITVGAANGITLPWDNHGPSYDSASWLHWDSEQPYYRICVELMVTNGTTSTRLYKCGLWEAVLEGEYPPSPLADCTGRDDLVPIPKSEVIVPLVFEG